MVMLWLLEFNFFNTAPQSTLRAQSQPNRILCGLCGETIMNCSLHLLPLSYRPLSFHLSGCCTEDLHFRRDGDGGAEPDHCNLAGPAAGHHRGNHLGEGAYRRPLDPGFSLTGVILWLAIVLVFPAIASFYPAWKASRLTVNEVLAGE